MSWYSICPPSAGLEGGRHFFRLPAGTMNRQGGSVIIHCCNYCKICSIQRYLTGHTPAECPSIRPHRRLNKSRLEHMTVDPGQLYYDFPHGSYMPLTAIVHPQQQATVEAEQRALPTAERPARFGIYCWIADTSTQIESAWHFTFRLRTVPTDWYSRCFEVMGKTLPGRHQICMRYSTYYR